MGRPPDIRGSPERPGTGGLRWVPPCDDLLSGMEFPVNFLAGRAPRPQMASMVRAQDMLLEFGCWGLWGEALHAPLRLFPLTLAWQTQLLGIPHLLLAV